MIPGESRRRVRVGVVGLGQLAREIHLPLLGTMPDVQVSAIADPLPEAVERCRPLAPAARVCRSVEELLRDSVVDAVLIASPTAEHATQARMVFAAGKALYLEKPAASTLADGLALVQAAGPAAHRVMMGFNYRFHPLAARTKRHLERDPGLVRTARCEFSIAPRALPAWKQRRASGGGVLLDLASHHFDLLRFLLGTEVTSVSARITSERTEDDCAEVELTFDNGFVARTSYSFNRSERDMVELTGPGTRIVLDRYAPLQYPVWPPGEFIGYQWERRRSPWKEVSFRRSLTAWIDSVREDAPPPVTLLDGLASLRVVAAAEESARTGAPVTMAAVAERARAQEAG